MPTATARPPAVRPAPRRRAGPRLTAENRRAEVLAAAIAEFGLKGLEGASTELIAKRARISQPYVFRLFPSKKKLFLAAVEQCFERVEQAFEAAARKPEYMTPAERLHAMGHAYLELLRRREWLLLQMQSYVACSDPDVRRLVQRRWARLHERAAALSEAKPQDLERFFAMGMLLNVLVTMGVDGGRDIHEWSHQVLAK